MGAIDDIAPAVGWSKLAVKVVLGLIAVALLGLVIWWVFIRPGQKHEEAVQAGATAKAATSQVETAKDANATGERVQVVHDRIERITRENTTRILAAPGASDAVSAGVSGAFLAAVCLRDAYQHDPACIGVRQPVAEVGDGSDARSPATK